MKANSKKGNPGKGSQSELTPLLRSLYFILYAANHACVHHAWLNDAYPNYHWRHATGFSKKRPDGTKVQITRIPPNYVADPRLILSLDGLQWHNQDWHVLKHFIGGRYGGKTFPPPPEYERHEYRSLYAALIDLAIAAYNKRITTAATGSLAITFRAIRDHLIKVKNTTRMDSAEPYIRLPEVTAQILRLAAWEYQQGLDEAWNKLIPHFRMFIVSPEDTPLEYCLNIQIQPSFARTLGVHLRGKSYVTIGVNLGKTVRLPPSDAYGLRLRYPRPAWSTVFKDNDLEAEWRRMTLHSERHLRQGCVGKISFTRYPIRVEL